MRTLRVERAQLVSLRMDSVVLGGRLFNMFNVILDEIFSSKIYFLFAILWVRVDFIFSSLSVGRV